MNQLILRYAAGNWWLIMPEQKSGYIAPLQINDSAAEMVKYLKEGKSAEEIASILSEGDSSLISEITSDVEALHKSVLNHFKLKTD